jgi:integrase/recombinase XerD
MKKLTLSQVITGYLLDAEAEHLSPHTIADYTNSFRKLQAFLGNDPPFAGIRIEQLRAFMADLKTPRAPAGVARRPERALSKKTCLNIHAALSALFTWAVDEQIVKEHLMRNVGRPAGETRAVVPFTQDEVRSILKIAERSRVYSRPGKRDCDHSRTTAERDRAIILLLLDTGMRASEMCELEIHEVKLEARHVKVFGKGDKERVLPFSASTGKAIWHYLSVRRRDALANAPLFLGRNGQPMTRSGLLQLLTKMGKRAGVLDTHPHRFRHTFAINFLRNGGNIYTLQAMLGHTTLDMVRKYLTIAQADVQAAHRLASPVENWHL